MFTRIREVRKRLGLSQKEFGGRIGLTQTSLSLIEIGSTHLTEKNIKLICSIFDINEIWLRTGEGDMFGSSSPYEKEFLNIFSKLTPETQGFLLELAKSLLKRQAEAQVDKMF